MTTPKVATKRAGGARFYVKPGTSEQVPGVTSVLNVLAKPYLQGWAAKMAGELAVDDLATVVGLAQKDRQAAVDYVKGASRRYTAAAAQQGTAAHDVFERMARGDTVDRRTIDNDLGTMADHFDAFLQEFQPEFLELEETVWSDTHGYAGSFDAIMRIPSLDETIMADWKTTRSGVHAETALQLTAYRQADFILRANGDEDPLPETSGAGVLHVRPEGWGLYPVRSDDAVFEAFLHLLGTFTGWEHGLSKEGLVAPPINANPTTVKRKRPTRKKAAK